MKIERLMEIVKQAINEYGPNNNAQHPRKVLPKTVMKRRGNKGKNLNPENHKKRGPGIVELPSARGNR